MVHAIISQLTVYPVKSCAGVQVKEALLIESGLELDRAWMVVDAKGDFLSQRKFPRMALIQPQLRHEDMVLRAPGMLALHVKIGEVEGAVQVRIWDDRVPAFDMGKVAAQWFSDFLGAPVRLVRFDPDHKRLSDLQWTGGVEALNQFNDGYPLVVIGAASLAQFNDKLTARGAQPAEMARFRPNIVLASVPGETDFAPHDEDRLDLLHIQTGDPAANPQLKLVKPCVRCTIPDVDPQTALRSPEVGDLLQSERQDPRVDGRITFGMNAIVLGGVDALVKVGQRVRAELRFD
ncbi:MAG: MOSC N-terminal beta barrel domain-containing protein [Polaromonas sp.]|nr:MOSC N-terminal beta barrel domain-containing protein [Polaromonas sp.]